MPSRPRSSLELAGSEFSFDEMSMKPLVDETLAVLSNTRTWPVFCTTYQRAELPGACSMRMGCVKFGRFGNTRCVSIETPLGGSPARQLVLLGRASRPEEPVGVGVGAGVGVGVGAGAGAGTGGLGEDPPPPPHPAMTAASAWTSRLVAIRGERMRETSGCSSARRQLPAYMSGFRDSELTA